MEKKGKEKKCWECGYHDLTGNTFLGKCLWFKEHGKKIKEVPPETVDKGCKFFKEK